MARSPRNFSFGPVTSRRLGRSLGVNNVPPKNCSYSCVYCQLGRTTGMTIKRSHYQDEHDLFEDVSERVNSLEDIGERIDYIAFVPDGEPTLDLSLGREMELLTDLGYPLAIISNSSLIWDGQVREDLKRAQWVSLKVDSVSVKPWKDVDRPHGKLALPAILEGILTFSREFEGMLCTETMLVEGVNDDPEGLVALIDFLEMVSPHRAYISVPVRPPAEDWVNPPASEITYNALRGMMERGIRADVISSLEDEVLTLVGDVGEEIIRIASVHPIRRETLSLLLSKAGQDWGVVEDLIEHERLTTKNFMGETFYITKF